MTTTDLPGFYGTDHDPPADWCDTHAVPRGACGCENVTGTWDPVDLADFITGQWEPIVPTTMPRTDGVCLLYPGKIHAFIGESESGKSLIVQAHAVTILNSGGKVLYLDHESDAYSVVKRLQRLGATDDNIARGLVYVRPADPLTGGHRQDFTRLLQTPLALAVIDGVTEALAVVKPGTSTNDNDGVAAFMNAYPGRIARVTGAPVALVDHQPKNTDTRGRFAIGAQAKMSALSGAAYIVEPRTPLGRGTTGTVHLRVAKDREGAVRPHAGPMRPDRTQLVAVVTVDDTGDHTAVTIEPPPADGGKWQPTALMVKVSRLLEMSPEPLSQSVIRDAVGGKKDYVRQALAALIEGGYVTAERGPRGATLHKTQRAYESPTEWVPTHGDGE